MAEQTPPWLAGEIKVDVGEWVKTDSPMRNFRLWNQCAPRGDFATQNELMTTAVKAWPYPFDPAELDSYDKLQPEDWYKVARAVGEAITGFFSSKANGNR